MDVMRRRKQQLDPLRSLTTALPLAKMAAGMAGPTDPFTLPDVGQVTSDLKVDDGSEPTSAIARRLEELKESPQQQIANSVDSLKFIQDPEQRRALAAPLIQAELRAKKGLV